MHDLSSLCSKAETIPLSKQFALSQRSEHACLLACVSHTSQFYILHTRMHAQTCFADSPSLHTLQALRSIRSDGKTFAAESERTTSGKVKASHVVRKASQPLTQDGLCHKTIENVSTIVHQAGLNLQNRGCHPPRPNGCRTPQPTANIPAPAPG